MGSIHELDDQRPHLTVSTLDGNVHVLPLSLIQNVIKGNFRAETLGDDVLRAIVDEWLTYVQGEE